MTGRVIAFVLQHSIEKHSKFTYFFLIGPLSCGVGSRDAGFLTAVPVSLGDSSCPSGVSADSVSFGDDSFDLVAPLGCNIRG